MRRARVALGISLWAAISLALAQEPARPAANASSKTEQPATAAGGQTAPPAGGQSSGASPETAQGPSIVGFDVETVVIVGLAVAAAVGAANVGTDTTTSH